MSKQTTHTYTCNPDLSGFEAFTDHTGTTVTVKINSTVTHEAIARAAAVLATIAAVNAAEDFAFIEDVCS
ncbi:MULTISPECIES: hypothetical protein [unclassified Luteococcus]|uniref:hypothetical protein n=1 Tax=unclassified Luteococcus TaxID=2639923 RepID=UPI00313DC932